jgi:mono/diheme cytochrome c family protein
MGSQREAILGTYLGNGNPANMFKTLKEDESGYVLVLYDSLAAYTVGQIWGKTGQKVNLMDNATQFPEGSVIVKLAFSNVNYPEWPVMQGAQVLNVYDTIPTTADPATGYQMRKVSFFQMDVIVKDSATAPKTGWVYSTFVYDKDTTGSFWDKMVPLGAMWGNDPNVNSPQQPPYPALSETVIYAGAPPYSTETLGWGGRLSGPNDGAVSQEAVDISTGQVYQNLALSSCMSCHSPAQDTFKSFLLPGPFPSSDTLYVYTPGSANWDLWFRDNWGNVPFNEGQVAMDYDMVMAFKSVPQWEAAQSSGQNSLLKANLEAVARFRRHRTQSRFWH